MIAPYNCIVVANGSFPTAPFVLDLLSQAKVILSCDGATGALHRHGFEPDAIIGDLDSLPPALQARYAGRIHQVIDQEINDLTKAVRFARESGERQVLILGATGLREDHTLGNISLLMEYASWFDRVEMASDYGWFTPLLGSATLESVPGQQVSLFSMAPNGVVTTRGLKWPLAGRRLTAWWQGTLNEALGRDFTLTLSEEARILVYRLFPITAGMSEGELHL